MALVSRLLDWSVETANRTFGRGAGWRTEYLNVVRVCPCKTHAWVWMRFNTGLFSSGDTVLVRKPIGKISESALSGGVL